ncbi:ECF transporter S component [Eubacteriales bacterium KG127]
MNNSKLSKNDSIYKMILTGLMIALICVATMIIKIPVPMTEGYVHLGDTMIFMAAIMLGKIRGGLAAGIGSALGDLFAGYAAWIPWTLGIKFLMGFIAGILIERLWHKTAFGNIIAMVIAGLEMVVGYYVAASVMYGNWILPIASIPWNIGQFAIGIILSIVIILLLKNTPIAAIIEENVDKCKI